MGACVCGPLGRLGQTWGPKDETRGGGSGGRDSPVSPTSGLGVSRGRRCLEKESALLEWGDTAAGASGLHLTAPPATLYVRACLFRSLRNSTLGKSN